MVEVACDRAAVAVPHFAGRRREPVPDALAAAVLVVAPSIWYDAVAAPQTKSDGSVLFSWSGIEFLSAGGGRGGDMAAGALRRARRDERRRDLVQTSI